MEEFNLTKRIQEVNDYELDNQVHPATKTDVIEVEDVKEFIKILKEETNNLLAFEKNKRIVFNQIINKLAGDSLIEKSKGTGGKSDN